MTSFPLTDTDTQTQTHTHTHTHTQPPATVAAAALADSFHQECCRERSPGSSLAGGAVKDGDCLSQQQPMLINRVQSAPAGLEEDCTHSEGTYSPKYEVIALHRVLSSVYWDWVGMCLSPSVFFPSFLLSLIPSAHKAPRALSNQPYWATGLFTGGAATANRCFRTSAGSSDPPGQPSSHLHRRKPTAKRKGPSPQAHSDCDVKAVGLALNPCW
jgi:hypothetical protein